MPPTAFLDSIRLEMTSKTRLLLQMQNGRKIIFYFLPVTVLGKTTFFSHFGFFFCCSSDGKMEVMSSLPSILVSCLILLWRQLQRREHTPWCMDWKKSALKLWEEIASFYFRIPLQKCISSINEIYWCPQDSKKVSHLCHWCFLNGLMILIPILPTKFCSR